MTKVQNLDGLQLKRRRNSHFSLVLENFGIEITFKDFLGPGVFGGLDRVDQRQINFLLIDDFLVFCIKKLFFHDSFFFEDVSIHFALIR